MSDIQHAILRLTRKVTADVEANRFVNYAGAVPAAGAVAAGPVYNKAAANEYVAVTVLGAATAVAGGAIREGAELQCGADGKVITRTTGKTVAFALESASADGDALEVSLIPSHT